MDVPKEVEQKLDAELASKLRAANPEHRVRVVARLGASSADGANAPTPGPSEFPSREAWRSDRIARQRASIEKRYGQTLESIRQRGVQVVTGGSLSTTLILEGSSSSIVKALQLEDVVHADIDRKLSLEGR